MSIFGFKFAFWILGIGTSLNPVAGFSGKKKPKRRTLTKILRHMIFLAVIIALALTAIGLPIRFQAFTFIKVNFICLKEYRRIRPLSRSPSAGYIS